MTCWSARAEYTGGQFCGGAILFKLLTKAAMGPVIRAIALIGFCFFSQQLCIAQEKTAETANAQKADPEVPDSEVATTGPAGESSTDEAVDGDAEGPLAGHSFHSEVFNEGPRQMALLLPGMGTVDFPVTTSNPEAQSFFNQGVAQLHGFWYFESERTFRRVSQLDPQCAMAYWGMAMSNIENDKRAKGFIEEAFKLREPASPREKRYIESLNSYLAADEKKDKKQRATQLAEDFEMLVTDFPDDIEAKAFLAIQYWHNLKAGQSIQSHVAIDALLQDIFDANPAHPAHHYQIHLWDSKKPAKALASAAACGPAAPGIAHMWHMPGHIYSRLNRYVDSARQQEASARVDHQHMMEYQVLPDQIHNFAHNNEWLVRNLINIGRVSDGMDLAKNMIELPQHPAYNQTSRGGSSAAFGRSRLLGVLNSYEMWEELLCLADSPYFQAVEDRDDQVRLLRSIGIAQFQLGNIAEGQARIEELTALSTQWIASKQTAIKTATDAATAEGKEAKDVKEAGTRAGRSAERGIKEARAAIDVLEGFALVAEGDIADGYEKLKDARSVDTVLRSRILFQAEKKDEAIEMAKKHADSHPNEVLPLAGLVELLWKAERKDETVEAFGKLRAISSEIDLTAPIFVRLTEVAKSLEMGDDWRLPASLANDVAVFPDLDSLGPFRWQPSQAPSFELPDSLGLAHSLKQYEGRPVVVVFYLGHGCLHCAEQLKAIGPMAAEFENEGISLLAISSDDYDGLKQSIESFGDVPFSFPLVADPGLETFRKYRAYDDFEQQPLHGTFAIDEAGRVIWQDISFEPFMNIRFVLDEILRQRQIRAFQGKQDLQNSKPLMTDASTATH